MNRLQKSAALLALLAMAASLDAPPSRADDRLAALQRFADQTLRTSDAGLDSLARQFQPLQIAFVAEALAAAPEGTLRDADYEAVTRWHFWLNGHLDPQNVGLWTVDRGRGISAPIAALELVQLRALAVMAQRRGYGYDALVWWKEHHTLRRRLAQRLYDPLRGAYADLDSTGAPLPWQGPEAIVPLALGAPAVLAATAQASRRWLWDDDPELSPSSVRLRASQALDPLQGWPLRRGLDLWEIETNLSLLRAAVGLLPGRELDEILREALLDLGLQAGSALSVRLGTRVFDVPLPRTQMSPLARSEAALDFLTHVGLLTEEEAQPLRDAAGSLDPAAPVPGDVIERLGESLPQWRALDLATQQARNLGSRRITLLPNGSGRAQAFSFESSHTATWTREALRLLTRDFIELHLRSAPTARYRAELSPHALPRRSRPELKVTLSTRGDRDLALGQTWNGAWTDGEVVDRPFVLKLAAAGELAATCPVPSPPDEMGLWWLILEGPLRTPTTAPGVAVVEPFEARVTLDGPDPRGAAQAHVRITSRVDRPLRGRMEAIFPLQWRLEPQIESGFVLTPGQRREWTLDLEPVENVSAGRYRLAWNFYEGDARVSRLEEDLVVPFRWLRIGPFAATGDEPLDTPWPPDTLVDLGRSYPGASGDVTWRHLPARAHQGAGWVVLDAGEAPAIWYALTAFSSASDLVRVELESSTDALVRLNGELVARCDRFRDRQASDAELRRSTNYVLVKIVGSPARPPRFRLSICDVDGGPLRAVDNELEHLMEGIAYVRGPTAGPEDPQAIPPRRIPITYRDPTARAVAVVGSFNSWSPTASPMASLGNGLWRAEVMLKPGRFEYKIAIDGGQWTTDPANPRWTSDGFGGRNSVLVVE